MGPFLSAIVASIMGTLAIDTIRPPQDVDRMPATVLALGLIAFAWVSARLHHSTPGERKKPPRWWRPADLFIYACLLFATDWTTVAGEATLHLPFLRHLLVLAPYFLAALARVEAAWPAEKGEQPDEHHWTRAQAVAFHAKLLLIPVLPLILILGLHDTARLVPGVRELLAIYPVMDYAAMATLFVIAMLLMPGLLKVLLGSRRLEGPVRELLDADLAAQGVRIGGIERVDTGGLIHNAAWLGLTLSTGRIFISDALLESLSPQEVRAVFAHEVAHGTRRHLGWFLLLFLASMLASYVAGDVIGAEWLGMSASIVSMAVAVIAFIAISRRFEVEADLVGSDTLKDPELFARALAHVGAVAGKPIDRHGARHFSIGSRVDIVRSSAAEPAVRAFWQRSIRTCKLAIAALFVLVLIGVAWRIPNDLGVGGALADQQAVDEAREQIEKRRREGETRSPEAAARSDAELKARLESILARARKGLDHAPVRSQAALVGIAAQMALADEALRLGRFDEARAIAADVETNWPRGDIVGDLNRVLLDAQLAAIDPAHDLASARPKIRAALDAIDEFIKAHGHNTSSDWVQQEMSFLAAAAGLEGFLLEYDQDSFESSRVLALARGAQLAGAESREAVRALARLPEDSAWRQVVLERALGQRPEDALKYLVAAETRRSSR